MDITMLVNKVNLLEENYIPEDLVQACFIEGNHVDKSYVPMLTKEAYVSFLKMNEAAKKDGFYLLVDSGYRSYDYQKRIYEKNVEEKGIDYTKRYVALPGSSEHQTGLAFDVAFLRNGVYVDDFLEDAPELEWMRKNAHLYGFILRYPKGKEDITGYNYEPWHYRYVGEYLSRVLFETGETLEEYYYKMHKSKTV